MKVTINAKTLTNALKAIKPVTSANSKKIPILGSVHLRADGETVTLTAQSVEQAVRVVLPATPESPGECVVLAKLLTDCLSSEKGDATLEFRNLRLSVTAQGASAEFPTFNAEDYPAEGFAALAVADACTLVELDARTLLDALDRTSFAASEDESRFNLCGVHLEANPNNRTLTFVATDGYRLSRVNTDLSATGLDLGGNGETIRNAGLNVLTKLTKTTKVAIVNLSMDENYIVAKCGSATLVFKRMISMFPNWKQVVPETSTTTVKASKDALLEAIKPGKKAGTMTFETGEALAISYRDGDTNETKRQAAATCNGSLKIAFNPAYLVEALESFDSDDVVLKMSDNLAPAIISAANDDTQISVIMPMRL